MFNPETFQQTEFGTKLKDVEFIWARNSKEFLFSNSILIHGDKPVLVDPSASFTSIERLAHTNYVHTVLNTHYHGDHRSLNQLFKSRVYFASHEKDALAISDTLEYNKISDGDPNSFYSKWIRSTFKKYKIVECPVSIKLKDQDVIETGAERIHIIHIPGHTPGHLALYFENANALFISDIDLTPHGPWYANVFSSIEEFKASIEKVKNFDCDFYITSHGERIYDQEKFLKKLERYATHFENRDSKIIDIVKAEPCDLGTLCSHGIVYKKLSLTDSLKCYFQFRMVEKHVNAFIKQEILAKDGEKLVFIG